MDPGAEQLAGWRGVQKRRIDAALPALGYFCGHGVATPAGAADVDHLVIGPAGTFVVIGFHCADEVRKGSDGRVWCGGNPLEGTIDGAHTVGGEVAALLGSHVSAVLAVHEGEVKTPPVVRGVYLVAGREVTQLIEARPVHRSPAETALAAARAKTVLRGGEWTDAITSTGIRRAQVEPVTERPTAHRSGWRSWFSSR